MRCSCSKSFLLSSSTFGSRPCNHSVFSYTVTIVLCRNSQCTFALAQHESRRSEAFSIAPQKVTAVSVTKTSTSTEFFETEVVACNEGSVNAWLRCGQSEWEEEQKDRKASHFGSKILPIFRRFWASSFYKDPVQINIVSFLPFETKMIVESTD